MDNRIEAFLQDVLALEGGISQSVRDGVRRYLIIYEKQFRDAGTPQAHEGHCSACVPRSMSGARGRGNTAAERNIDRATPEGRARRHRGLDTLPR